MNTMCAHPQADQFERHPTAEADTLQSILLAIYFLHETAAARIDAVGGETSAVLSVSTSRGAAATDK